MHVGIIYWENNPENYSSINEEVIQINLYFTFHSTSILKAVTIYKIHYVAHKRSAVEVKGGLGHSQADEMLVNTMQEAQKEKEVMKGILIQNLGKEKAKTKQNQQGH